MLVVAFLLLGGGALLITSGVADPEKGVLGLLGDLMKGKLPQLKAAGDPLSHVADLTAPAPSGGSAGGKSTGTSAPSGGGIVGEARRQLGKPYKFGGAGPASFDCSGLTWWAVQKSGAMSWSRMTAEGQRASKLGATVKASEATAGDLIFFGIPASHCGVYIGGGQMIHAPHTGDVVKVSSASGGGRPSPVTYRRFPKGGKK